MPNIPGNITGIFDQQSAVIAMCCQQLLCFIFIFTAMGFLRISKIISGVSTWGGGSEVGKCCCRGNKMAVYSELHKIT